MNGGMKFMTPWIKVSFIGITRSRDSDPQLYSKLINASVLQAIYLLKISKMMKNVNVWNEQSPP